MSRVAVSRRRWSLPGLRAFLASGVLGAALVGLTSSATAPAAFAAPVGAKGNNNHPGKGPGAKTGAKTGSKKGKPKVMLERHVAATKGGQPNVQALGALVLDEQGRELFSRNPDRERPIASVSKLAAVLVVMDRGVELDGLTTITKTDLEVARGGAHSRLLEGLTVSNRDLLHAALLGSDNRAIPALGRAVKLSPTQLAAAMTAKAKELGLLHTRFHDPTGLSPENVSTPRDTIAMLKAVMKQPVLAGITHRLTYEAHPVGKPPIVYTNTYKPAIRRGIEVLGGKTGYNDEARYCLVIATRIAGQTYFMSFLSNEGKLTRFGDVARVADWIVQHRPNKGSELVASGAPGTDKSAAASANAAVPAGAVTASPEPQPAAAAPSPSVAPAAVPAPAATPVPAAAPAPAATPATHAGVPAPSSAAPSSGPAWTVVSPASSGATSTPPAPQGLATAPLSQPAPGPSSSAASSTEPPPFSQPR